MIAVTRWRAGGLVTLVTMATLEGRRSWDWWIVEVTGTNIGPVRDIGHEWKGEKK